MFTHCLHPTTELLGFCKLRSFDGPQEDQGGSPTDGSSSNGSMLAALLASPAAADLVRNSY
jgi:hypothetical protein